MKVLKIGGSLITKKSGYREPDAGNMAAIASAVAAVWKKGARDFVVVHGAGSFGHPLVLKHGIKDGVQSAQQKLGYADTHAACSELSLLLVKALIEAGAPAISIPPAVVLTQKGGRISSFDMKMVDGYLRSGYLPVLYGDVVPDSALGGSVCSGDQIVSYLGRQADFVVLATNVDGVLDGGGRLIPEITGANFAEVSRHLRHEPGDVTGAMAGKIKELLSMDTPSYIVNGLHPERVAALMEGKRAACTAVRK